MVTREALELNRLTASLTDAEALFLTAWAEARGDGTEGHSSVEERIAVMCVCRNRLSSGRFGTSYRAVCLAPRQFSCWNDGTDPNHLALVALVKSVVSGVGVVSDQLAHETAFLADGVMSQVLLDRTGGATHYFAPASMTPISAVPPWAVNQPLLASIGHQRFYRVA